jgi:hypothetical protein
MSEALLRELAERIAREHFLSQWPIYTLMLILAFIGSALASYLGSYFKKRGENLATKTDFNNLLAQIKATTIATEDVKSKISNLDWSTKERKVLLRNKLEELLHRLHELEDWQDEKRYIALYTEEKFITHSSTVSKATIIIALYFPELRQIVHNHILLHRKIMILLSNSRAEFLKLKSKNDYAGIASMQNKAADDYLKIYTEQIYSLASINDECHTIMNELIIFKNS